MKRFKPVRNRSNKRLTRKHSVARKQGIRKHCHPEHSLQSHGIHDDLQDAVSSVGHSVQGMTVISGTLIKNPVDNRKEKKEEETVLSSYKEKGLYSMVGSETKQLS